MIVIDPIRDTQAYLDLADQHSVSIKFICQTHYHADFVSGFLDLASKTGATVVYGPDSSPNFEATILEDSQSIQIGEGSLKLLHTPGHTFESSCYLLSEDGEDLALFSGDTLFLGDVGRPDLAQKGEFTKEDLASMLYESIDRLKSLDDHVMVLPCHGAGSSCGKNISSGSSSTIGVQKRENYAMKIEGKAQFVEAVVQGLENPPSYFPKNVQLNKEPQISQTSDILERSMTPISVEELKNLLNTVDQKNNKQFILDIRDAESYDLEHIPGSLYIPLDGRFAIWSAYLINPEDDVILVCQGEGKEFEDQARQAITRLARTGLENVRGYLEGGINAWKEGGSNPLESVQYVEIEGDADFQQKMEGQYVLDIRNTGEVADGILASENTVW